MTPVQKALWYIDVTLGAMIGAPVVEHLKANVKNLEAIHLGPGRHFIQETYPDEIGQGIANWLKTH